MTTSDLPAFIHEVHNAVLEKKGESPLLLDLRELTTFTDYFYIVSGWSERQAKAIFKAIDEVLRRRKEYSIVIEGERNSSWFLIEYGPVIFHVFNQRTREYYDLEHLWADAARIDLGKEV